MFFGCSRAVSGTIFAFLRQETRGYFRTHHICGESISAQRSNLSFHPSAKAEQEPGQVQAGADPATNVMGGDFSNICQSSLITALLL